ncbi:phosphoethanolamine--lipid A transferase EptA [Fontimonas sp. SYSU GA230001]|uniref:phosphoethanolamine--lipid A transferase EptA n=1 Tax=Fontimonas sp. SYSU GA230001 TaxID=3142450 RepID=UPI0032B4F0FA
MSRERTRRTLGAVPFIALAALGNALLYHAPLLSFAVANLDLTSFTGLLTLASLLVALLASTALPLLVLALVSQRLLKPFCMIAAAGNAVAVYFIVTYQVVLDKTMMGNVRNTNAAEAFELFHPTLLAYVVVLGVVPIALLTRVRLRPAPRLRLAGLGVAGALVTILWAYLAGSTWLWFDHNAKKLGGMVLPWSYMVNLARYQLPRLIGGDAPIPLPPATFLSDERIVVVLVIGEAARPQNFQLYGYPRPTNPALTAAGVIALQDTTACSTYTTASIRCMLSHLDSRSEFSKRYEPLPTYLQRHGVDVIWRSHNWGEPPLHVQTYQKAGELAADCRGAGCEHDDVLLHGLEQRIRASSSSRSFVVLHQMGSHGPAYFSRYPPEFERFRPVCTSVELGQCAHDALVNAYDNTILYTDHFLARTIDLLRRFEDRATLLIYMSDHGESLGEYGLYLHGTPWSIAPDVQKKVPFIVWMSEAFMRLRGVDAERVRAQPVHGQRDIFHTVLGALRMRSEVYRAEFDVFSPDYARTP